MRLDAPVEEPASRLEFIHGYAMVVPGLERALQGRKAGDRVHAHLSAAEAFGDRIEDLVFEVERTGVEVLRNVREGDTIELEDDDGDIVFATVVGVDGEVLRVDANHPLAGRSVTYELEIESVRLAHDGELEDAARAFADLDEAMAADAGELVPLRSRESDGAGASSRPPNS